MNRLQALAAVVMLAATPAMAEPVFLTTGTQDGQGWVSKQGSDCIVVTARHVFEGRQTGRVVTRGGLEGYISRVERHPDPAIDIAILWVEGDLKDHCPVSGLGFADSRRELSDTQDAGTPLFMEISATADLRLKRLNANQLFSIPVIVRGIDPRSDIPTFAFVAARSDIPLPGRGDSGAPIVTPKSNRSGSAQPVGIVVEEGALTIAVRFDLARSFFQQLRGVQPAAVQRAGAVPVSLAGFSGKLADEQCGPLQVLIGNLCRMRATALPGRSTVDLELSVPEGVSVSEVSIAYGEAPPAPFSINIAGVGGEWTQARYCRPEGATLRCAFGRFNTPRLKLSFTGVADVRSISIR